MLKKYIICNIEFNSIHKLKTCSIECCEHKNRKSRNEMQRKLRQKRLKENFYSEIIANTKICYVCKKEKSINNFAKDKYVCDKHSYDCYECRRNRKNDYDKTEEAKKVRRSRENTRRKEDSNFKLIKNIRTAIWRNIKNPIKKDKLITHLPFTIKQLEDHLQKQFDPNMSWDNYGSYWHIDHIKPIASFIIGKVGDFDFLKCWDLSNLRPLEKTENIKKGARVL